MKKIIFFDLDGTISDSGEGIVNAITYAERKLEYTPISLENKKGCIGPPLVSSFMRLYSLSFDEAEHMIDVYREYYSDRGIFENYLYPNVKETLELLYKKGFEMRICSAKPLVMVERVLKHFGVFEYFSALQGAELHGEYPGKAAFIRSVLENEPARAVMIGDRRDDIEGGKGNNIATIGVLWGYGSLEELQNAGADFTVKNTAELISAITHIFD